MTVIVVWCLVQYRGSDSINTSSFALCIALRHRPFVPGVELSHRRRDILFRKYDPMRFSLSRMLLWCVCGGAAACVIEPVCIASNSLPHPRAPLLPHVHQYILPSIKELLSIPSLILHTHPFKHSSTSIPPCSLGQIKQNSRPLVDAEERNFC